MDEGEGCECSEVRAAEDGDAVGKVDIRRYAAALPYALAGVAAAGCILHRALAANVDVGDGLMLWDWTQQRVRLQFQGRTGPAAICREGGRGEC